MTNCFRRHGLLNVRWYTFGRSLSASFRTRFIHLNSIFALHMKRPTASPSAESNSHRGFWRNRSRYAGVWYYARCAALNRSRTNSACHHILGAIGSHSFGLANRTRGGGGGGGTRGPGLPCRRRRGASSSRSDDGTLCNRRSSETVGSSNSLKTNHWNPLSSNWFSHSTFMSRSASSARKSPFTRPSRSTNRASIRSCMDFSFGRASYFFARADRDPSSGAAARGGAPDLPLLYDRFHDRPCDSSQLTNQCIWTGGCKSR